MSLGRRTTSLGRGRSRIRRNTGNVLLDLYSVKTQIDRMVEDEHMQQADYAEKLSLAERQLRRWAVDWPKLAEKIAHSRTSWLLPGLIESPTARHSLPPRPEHISIAATDGSQIFPDRHEISACYLINIGYILLHYGTGEKPLMNSRPTLYYKDDDLFEEFGGRRLFANRDMIGFKRGLMEFTELTELSLAAHEEGHRVVALSDGTLILWNLEGKPQDFKQGYLHTTLQAMEELRQERVPVAGYISQPGSQEIVNALKLGLCPLEAADCDRCPWKGENQFGMTDEEIVRLEADLWQGRGLPCSPLEGITDAVLLRQMLKKGERTGLYRSNSKILDECGEHRIYFFYLHVGAEIGRVEIPQWVAEDAELLDLVHACVYDQAEKGQGYPVSLSEAHERAVVRGADREAFYRFLQETFIKNDIRASISTKSFKKRHAGI
jgi:hypothetical protein